MGIYFFNPINVRLSGLDGKMLPILVVEAGKDGEFIACFVFNFDGIEALLLLYWPRFKESVVVGLHGIYIKLDTDDVWVRLIGGGVASAAGHLVVSRKETRKEARECEFTLSERK